MSLHRNHVCFLHQTIKTLCTGLLLAGFSITVTVPVSAQKPKQNTIGSDTAIQLKLGRELRPFDEYLVKAMNIRISRYALLHGNREETVQADTVRSTFAGTVTVNNVTEDGQEAVKTVVVRNAETRYQGQNTTIVSTGTTIKAFYSDTGYVYTVNDDTLAAAVTADLVGLLRSEGGLKTGVIMNPPKPVRVGDSWHINADAFAATLGSPPKNKKRIVTGKATFKKVDVLHDIPVAVVSMKASVTNAVDSLEGMPVENATIEATLDIAVPIDERYPTVWVASNTHFAATVGKAPQQMRISYTVADEFDFQR